jgi:hypothetical protein
MPLDGDHRRPPAAFRDCDAPLPREGELPRDAAPADDPRHSLPRATALLLELSADRLGVACCREEEDDELPLR